MSETMKSLGKAGNTIAKDKNGENVPLLEITQIVLVYGNLASLIINMIHGSCVHLFQIDHLVIY